MSEYKHRPVLLDESVEALNIKPDGKYLDGTFGRGGHSGAILARLSGKGCLLSLDRDPEAVAAGRTMMEEDHRLTVVERGNRSVIDTFFEEGLDGTHWHGNIVDICPVGALVSKEFLHKARAWDLTHTASICTG